MPPCCSAIVLDLPVFPASSHPLAASLCSEQLQLSPSAPLHPKSVATSLENVVLARILFVSPKPRRRCLRFY